MSGPSASYLSNHPVNTFEVDISQMAMLSRRQRRVSLNVDRVSSFYCSCPFSQLDPTCCTCGKAVRHEHAWKAWRTREISPISLLMEKVSTSTMPITCASRLILRSSRCSALLSEHLIGSTSHSALRFPVGLRG
jgi:hypothetical protein